MGPLHPTLISTSYRLGRFPFILESLSLKPTSWQSSPSLLEREEQTERGLLSEWAGNQPALFIRNLPLEAWRPQSPPTTSSYRSSSSPQGGRTSDRRAFHSPGSGLPKVLSGPVIPSPQGFLLDRHDGRVFPLVTCLYFLISRVAQSQTIDPL